jgi:hypothetical protein
MLKNMEEKQKKRENEKSRGEIYTKEGIRKG